MVKKNDVEVAEPLESKWRRDLLGDKLANGPTLRVLESSISPQHPITKPLISIGKHKYRDLAEHAGCTVGAEAARSYKNTWKMAQNDFEVNISRRARRLPARSSPGSSCGTRGGAAGRATSGSAVR